MKYAVVAILWSVLVALAGWPSATVQAQAGRQEPGVVTGAVRDVSTGEPVGWAQILLEEANRSTASDEEGAFRLINIPAGSYTLKVFRIGYEPLIRRVTVPSGDTLRLDLQVASSPIVAGEILVEEERAANGLTDPALHLEGRELDQNLGTTIAETLENQPGISMRSMGPAPARPVLRGLGGERLLVLEDGGRTGDLSATSSDHAVVIEPMTAERIEVVRGPAALVFGPNTLGGVVNVIRGYIPTARPDDVQVAMSLQGQSVSQGYSGGASVTAPLGPLAVSADGSIRQAGDVNTPESVLKNTALETYNASLGASVVRRHGYLGVAGSYYLSEYGIPGGFVGAHPGGVDIRLNRKHVEMRGEFYPHSPRFQRAEGRAQFSRYFQQEFEKSGSVGVEFGVLTGNASFIGYTSRIGPFRKGAVGVWGEYRNHASGGYSFTPNSVENTVAAFAFQEAALGSVTLQAGLRYDYRTVEPEEESASPYIGLIRRRTFDGLSFAVSGTWHPSSRVSTGVSFMRSLRMPGIEELYSEGPHLAAYSFEVGNPELGLERGWGSEVSLRYTARRIAGSVALFYNYVNGYIYPRNTGEINLSTLLATYQFTGATAAMVGGEASGTLRLGRGFSLEGSGSYVRGTLVDEDEPLPFMPPLIGRGTIQYRRGPFMLGLRTRVAAEQERLGEFEERTDGYAVLDAFGEYYISTGRLLHTFDVSVENLTNAAYRDHLSRVKVIMPEPGINLMLLYKVYF